MHTLFNGDKSNSDEELNINTDYAKSYDNWRQKEELNKLKTKYGDVSGSEALDSSSNTDSSSEEEEENELKEQFDKDFYKTLACLKKKDPKIYNQDVTFFDDTNKAQELNSEKKKQKPNEKTRKEKAVFLRDYERNIIVEREGKFSDSEDESIIERNINDSNKITYVEEQKRLKESFKVALHDEEEEDDLLKPKSKSDREEEKEDADYKEWLKGQELEINEKEQEALKPLRDFWNNPSLDVNEKFLRDYVLNNKYLDNEYSSQDLDDGHIVHDSDENLSEDEKNIEKQEEFEHKYNFRFEEPDQEFIKRYPRTMENSLRRKDTRRAEKRLEVKKRKEEEKLRRKEDLKQLKALKRKEIEEKIEKLKEITGNEDIKFTDIDLEGDFDPKEYDKKMTEIFNEDYYGAAEGDVKPEFPDIDEELEIEETWDNYNPATDNYSGNGEENYEGTHCEDPDFNMDAEYDPSKSVQNEGEGTKKRKRRRQSKFAELIAKEKPKYDPQQYPSFQEYYDKYYSLDYEDMIGDIPCRFKYRKVVPNDYGLTIEEILMADDKELNKWCSLKRALQYKSEHVELNDVQMYKQKAKNEKLKRKILKSLYSNPEDEEETDKKEDAINPSTVSDESKNTKKKRKRNKKKHVVQNDSSTAKTVHKTGTNNKELKANDKIENNKDTAQEESKKKSKGAKRKEPEEQSEQPSKKKRKVYNSEESSSAVENKSHAEKEIVNAMSKKDQTHTKLKSQHFKDKKKMNFDKMKKKNFGKAQKKDFKQKETNGDMASLNPERLKTYGINPKKFKNKLKYGKQQQ